MLHKHNDLSIRQAAHDLFKEHGAEAEDFAASKMHHFMKCDDAKQASYWLAIVHEIKSLPLSSVN